MQECCHFINQGKWTQAAYLENQNGVCCVFKSEQTFSLHIGVFSSFDFEFKLSEVFILKKAQKVLTYKDRLNKDSWDFCRHYLYVLYVQQIHIITFISQY